jgi:hypothetical protein
MIIPDFYIWTRKPFLLVHMHKSEIIIRVWLKPFFLVRVKKSGIIILAWAQSFFLVHM